MTVLRFKEIDKPGNYLTKYSKNKIISKKHKKKNTENTQIFCFFSYWLYFNF